MHIATSIAQRAENGFTRLVETIMERGDVSRVNAVAVANLYISRKFRAVKIDAVGGQFTVTHADFMGRDVIRRAVAMAAGR